jgi:Secretion system C-terminal sorting domain
MLINLVFRYIIGNFRYQIHTAMKTIYLFAAALLLLVQPAQAQNNANTQAVYGCTDPFSSNYNPSATVNNGSCTYGAASVNPDESITLSESLDETSGLILYDGNLYTLNDDTDTNLYRLNTQNGNITQTIALPGVTNVDWEEIAQDASYIYVGDFGNNANGNRSNLRILRISKASLPNNPVIDYINFSYSNQSSFAATGNNNTDFDCEAMVVSNSHIYLFTKQWVSQKTSVYELPKTPGTYTAQLQDTLDVNGLITGATYLEDKRLVVLCGYSTVLSPFMYLLYDFQGNDFFGGNKRKVLISQSFHQVEGIATANGLDYYITNEHFQQAIVNTPQKLHKVGMDEYLETYLDNLASLSGALQQAGVIVSPNPSGDVLNITGPDMLQGLNYYFVDMMGRKVLQGTLEGQNNTIDIAMLSTGIYDLVIAGFEDDTVKLAVQ